MNFKSLISTLCLASLITSTHAAYASPHHKASNHHDNNSPSLKHPGPVEIKDPQINIYSAHKEKNNYVIALYTDRAGKALITYDSPTCQANSYGDTKLGASNKSEIIFTSTEDPYCKITLQKTDNKQLKITKETPACNAWHGDFCNFSSLSPLTRIYPQ